MRTYNMPFINIRKENHPKLSQICMSFFFFEGLKNEFDTAVVNEPSVFEPLKFYCILAIATPDKADIIFWPFTPMAMPYIQYFSKSHS